MFPAQFSVKVLISTIYIRPTPKTMLYSVTYLVVNYVTLMSIISRFGLMARMDKHASKAGKNWILDRKAQYQVKAVIKSHLDYYIHAWRFHELFSNIFSFNFQSFGNSKNINREIVVVVQKWFRQVLNLCIMQKVLGMFWKYWSPWSKFNSPTMQISSGITIKISKKITICQSE